MFHNADRHDHRYHQSRVEGVLQVKVVDETDALVEGVEAVAVGRKKP